MKTKVKVIEAESVSEFEKKINEINNLFQVFATQTHTTMVQDKIYYTAVLFYRVLK